MDVVAGKSNATRRRSEERLRIRVFHRKAVGKRYPRYLVKCGCCDERLEIYYGDGYLEIAGVAGKVEEWREILIPLLDSK